MKQFVKFIAITTVLCGLCLERSFALELTSTRQSSGLAYFGNHLIRLEPGTFHLPEYEKNSLDKPGTPRVLVSLGIDLVIFVDNQSGSKTLKLVKGRGYKTGESVSVGFNLGSHTPPPGSTDRLAREYLTERPGKPIYERYQRAGFGPHGLERFELVGTDSDGIPFRDKSYGEDIYIRRNKDGEVITFIQCSNVNVAHPPCRHHFSLRPTYVADANAIYSRRHLETWQEVEQMTNAYPSTVAAIKK